MMPTSPSDPLDTYFVYRVVIEFDAGEPYSTLILGTAREERNGVVAERALARAQTLGLTGSVARVTPRIIVRAQQPPAAEERRRAGSRRGPRAT